MKTRFTKNCLSLAISFVLLLPVVNAPAGETTLVSVDSAGQQGNADSNTWSSPAVSADGRLVVFSSSASNLVAGDTNEALDVFVHDRTTGITNRVSVDSEGHEAGGILSNSFMPTLSADGRIVTFVSYASNLVAGDTNETNDIFVHDLSTGATSRVSVNSTGEEGNDTTYGTAPTSADGRFVAFFSSASNLVTDDSNQTSDVFVHDRTTGATARVSVNSAGEQGNSWSEYHAISKDGRFVAFDSSASNLVAGDTNGSTDIFVHDRNTGVTSRVSVDSAGQQANSASTSVAISADGRFVAFTSSASNLVVDDTNDWTDIFVHDRNTGATSRVSVNSAGEQGSQYASNFDPAISADGRFVSFWSSASNLVEGDNNGSQDIFVHDRTTDATTRVKVGSRSAASFTGVGEGDTLSADGRFVTFTSESSKLVAGDINGFIDAFVRDRQLIATKTADLQVAVTSRPASVQTGQTASYIYALTNNGPDSINTEVKLTDVIANGRVISLTPSQGFCSKAAVSVCRFGALANGASVTLTAVIKATSDPLTQQISVNAPPVDNVPGNNSVSVSTPVTP
ncbi:MAG: hypothetical protein ACXWT3_04185 [Methylococcaceae bacterium]